MNVKERQKQSLMKAGGITEADADCLIAAGIPTLAHALRAGEAYLRTVSGIGAGKAAALVAPKGRAKALEP